MTVDLVIRSDRVVLPGGERPAAVSVQSGVITGIADRWAPLPAVRETDIGADALLPGLVDTHVHINEPGRTHWEGFATATAAAAAGGVTTVLDMPLNSVPPTTSVSALGAKQSAAVRSAVVDVGFWAGAVPENLGNLGELVRAGVFGFKCFLVDSGVPEFPPLEGDQLVRCLEEIRSLDSVLLVHAEDPAAVRPAPSTRSYRDFLASRPAEAELNAITRLAALSVRTGARVHIVHLASAAALETVAQAKRAGAPLTVETCPHYLILDAEEIPDGATQFKCCPPIREASHREGLWRGLATGVIDCVVSDHSPCPPAMKSFDTGDFGTAWGGISSLGLGLALVWTQARRRGHTLADVARWMAGNPAKLARLAGRGRIEVGAKADLVHFAPNTEWAVEPARLRFRHSLTPYASHRLTGVVRQVWLAGAPIGMSRGRLVHADAE